MNPVYTITIARPHDLPFVAEIELAAARLLEGHAPESVLAETSSHEDLVEALRRGHLWVALDGDIPVGFAHVKQLEPTVVHLDELDVHPAHGRRGIGRRLVIAVCDWATHAGYDAVTLCTFRDLPWNMPFYASLGFEVVPPEARTPALCSLVDGETRRGLDPSGRVVMRRACVARASRVPLHATMAVRRARVEDRERLVVVWERSVRATHHFLTEADIVTLRPLVGQELASDAIDWWVLVSPSDVPIGFLGFANDAIEGLFIDPEHRSRGGGTLLVSHAQSLAIGTLDVDVNEQNDAAVRFYAAAGFSVVGRSPTDAGGRPFPLLRMRRAVQRSS